MNDRYDAGWKKWQWDPALSRSYVEKPLREMVSEQELDQGMRYSGLKRSNGCSPSDISQ